MNTSTKTPAKATVLRIERPMSRMECLHLKPFSWLQMRDDDGQVRVVLLLEKFRSDDTTLLVVDINDPEEGVWCEPKHVLKDLGPVAIPKLAKVEETPTRSEHRKNSRYPSVTQIHAPQAGTDKIAESIERLEKSGGKIPERIRNQMFNDVVRTVLAGHGMVVKATTPKMNEAGFRSVAYYIDMEAGITREDLENAAEVVSANLAAFLPSYFESMVVARKAIVVNIK